MTKFSIKRNSTNFAHLSTGSFWGMLCLWCKCYTNGNFKILTVTVNLYFIIKWGQMNTAHLTMRRIRTVQWWICGPFTITVVAEWINKPQGCCAGPLGSHVRHSVEKCHVGASNGRVTDLSMKCHYGNKHCINCHLTRKYIIH